MADKATKVDFETGEIIDSQQEEQTSKQKIINLFETAGGAINERIAYEMPKILDNLLDPNTDPQKARTLTIKVKFKGDRSRTVFDADVGVESKLVATDGIPIQFTIFKLDGEKTLMEIPEQLEGQQDITGGEQEEPKPVRMIRGIS